MTANPERRNMVAIFRAIKLWPFSLHKTFWLLSICQGIMKSPPGKSFLTFLQPLPCIHTIACSSFSIPSVFFSLSSKPEPHGPLAALLLVKLLKPSEWSGLLVMQWFWNYSNKQSCWRGNLLETFLLKSGQDRWAVGREDCVRKYLITVTVEDLGLC